MPTVEDAKMRMDDALEALRREFATVRTGKATPALLDTVRVDAYGSKMPVNQVATISTPDASLIVVQPFDKSLLAEVEKAIMTADLGLNPANDGNIIRVPIPPLNEERRKEYVKVARGMAEDGRIALRNVRREARKTLEHAERDGDISADDLERAEKELEKVTHEHVEHVDDALGRKEHELLEV